MNQTRIVEKIDYKGWSITVIEKRFNIAKPYIFTIRDPEGNARTIFRSDAIVTKESTYASLSTAREAGKVAVNFYMRPR